ncbi:type II toxin-antitoxin system RelE/ParE family toxin [Cryptosporangium sp. NPDC048952]|uniref:type II toxin-antitoxin system RelE/ParE family toxin n=1 Tax=Cryptosporangium sp. NPDC048952 TaxID=3363961 RepID=UPI00371814A5
MRFGRGAGGLVEGARVNEQTPSAQFIEELKRDGDETRLAKIQACLETYSRHGEEHLGRDIKELRQGLWELRAGDVRLPFFRVTGEAQKRCEHHTVVRLTHGFKKQGQRIPRNQIDHADWIRREDARCDQLT